MKPMTIWQRLDRALLLLILLLFVAVGLAFWVAWERSNASQRSDILSGDRDRVYYDVMLMIDSLRGMSADPKNELDRKRLRVAELELDTKLEGMQHSFKDFPDLLASVKDLSDFARETGTGTLGNFQSKVMAIADSDVAAALAFFNANYPPLSRRRDQLFQNLEQQVKQVHEAESMRAMTVSLVGGTCIILVAMIAYFVGRQQSSAIAEPLNRLVGNLDRMRRGDFTERLSLDQKDEFGVVGQGLNRLADDLCELVGQVQRSGIQVNTTATQISATAKEQQSTAHEIAATTAQIGATSKEISATSKDLVKTMNEVNHVAEETAKLAGSGQASIARMESTMHQIMEASGSITAKLAVLNEKTTNINSVVTTITKVADQTNLLSLNAAIEAEKAGEYGLGFAVVAMEIRRLADQTAVATYDIEKMVKEMHSAVAAGVMGMDKFSDEVRRGVAEVRQVSTHLAQIIHQVQTLTPRFQTVNEGMHAQAAGAEQISETLTQLSEAAQQTAESLRQSNLAIEQLNGAARGLQASVARFKLSTQPRIVSPGDGYGVGI
jgi:methyl-accepting chemotaxis protein